MGRDHESTIDPQLLRQVAKAATTRTSVGATLTLRSPDLNSRLSPEQTNSIVHKLLDRIERQTHSKPKDVNVFPNIRSFAIDAAPVFLKKLIRQPEIDSAVANHQPENLLIEPVESRVVSVELGDEDGDRSPTRSRPRRR